MQVRYESSTFIRTHTLRVCVVISLKITYRANTAFGFVLPFCLLPQLYWLRRELTAIAEIATHCDRQRQIDAKLVDGSSLNAAKGMAGAIESRCKNVG